MQDDPSNRKGRMSFFVSYSSLSSLSSFVIKHLACGRLPLAQDRNNTTREVSCQRQQWGSNLSWRYQTVSSTYALVKKYQFLKNEMIPRLFRLSQSCFFSSCVEQQVWITCYIKSGFYGCHYKGKYMGVGVVCSSRLSFTCPRGSPLCGTRTVTMNKVKLL